MRRNKASGKEGFSWLDVPKAIFMFIGQDRRKFMFLTALLSIVFIYELVPPLVVGWLVDYFNAFQRGDSLDTFYVLSFGLGVVHILASALRLTAKKGLGRILAKARARARIMGFERLLNFSMERHAKENTGNKTQRLLTGSQAIRDWGYLFSNELVRNAMVFSGVLFVFAWMNPKYVVFLLSYMAVYFTIERLFARRYKVLSDNFNKSQENSTGLMVEGTGNILTIKALGAEADFSARQKEAEDETAGRLCRMIDSGIGKWQAFQILGGIAFSGFLLLAGHDFLSGRITVGMVLIYFGYFSRLRECTISMADHITHCIEKKSDLARMMPIFQELEPENAQADFPARWGELVMKQCGFSYPSGREALCGVDLTVGQGEKIGIAGLSGSGKSTLVKLLLGLYRLENGHMKIGGKPYSEIRADAIMDNVSVVLQESELFNMSLRDNITLMRDVPPAILEHAIKVACLDGVVADLPNGIETAIGEKGYRLSGGEKQRLGIARAICKDAPILILDEATSALDTKTEKRIMDFLLGDYSAGRTVVVIAHRISTLRNTDRVVVFDQGSVVEEGSYANLVSDPESRLSSFYSVLMHSQMVRD